MPEKKMIEGKVVLKRSKDDTNCICCEGKHIFSREIILEPFKTKFPEHFGRGIEIWLKSNFELKELEGKTIRITAELI